MTRPREEPKHSPRRPRKNRQEPGRPRPRPRPQPRPQAPPPGGPHLSAVTAARPRPRHAPGAAARTRRPGPGDAPPVPPPTLTCSGAPAQVLAGVLPARSPPFPGPSQEGRRPATSPVRASFPQAATPFQVWEKASSWRHLPPAKAAAREPRPEAEPRLRSEGPSRPPPPAHHSVGRSTGREDDDHKPGGREKGARAAVTRGAGLGMQGDHPCVLGGLCVFSKNLQFLKKR